MRCFTFITAIGSTERDFTILTRYKSKKVKHYKFLYQKVQKPKKRPMPNSQKRPKTKRAYTKKAKNQKKPVPKTLKNLKGLYQKKSCTKTAKRQKRPVPKSKLCKAKKKNAYQ